MNLLSIMLYLADVLSGLAVAFGVLGTVILAVLIVVAIISAYGNSENSTWDKSNYDPKYTATKKWIKRTWIPVVFFIMATLIPSQNTVYMIAASEIAEEGYKSEIGQKLTNLVNDKLDAYLAEVSSKPVSETIKNIDPAKLSSDEVDYLTKKLEGLKK